MSLPWVSARLAAWADAYLAGAVSPDDVVEAVAGRSTHVVRGLPGNGRRPADPSRPGDADADGSTVGLSVAIAALRNGGAGTVHLVWPVPGDVAGLPGPAATNAAALGAGQAVVVEHGDPRVGAGLTLVPTLVDPARGSPGAPEVVWTALPAAEPRNVRTQLDEADRALRVAVREATEALHTLDVAHLPEEAAAAVETARSRAARMALPPGHPARAAGVLDSAQRLSSLLEIALGDQGAAITAAEVGDRAAALRHVQRSARHAFCAAVNALAESRLRAR